MEEKKEIEISVNSVMDLTSEEYDKYMCEKYPDIFRERNLSCQETCMCWGFDINRGWYELVDDLCKKLKVIQDVANIEVVAVQVKQKFGELRFYYDLLGGESKGKNIDEESFKMWSEIICGVISFAEGKSEYVCEKCGRRGKIRTGGWVVTLCDDCEAMRDGKK